MFSVGGGAHAEFAPLSVRKTTWTLGRAADCDVVLTGDPAVSRHHAVLTADGTAWRIRDLRSRNGTYVNGLRVSGSQPVEVGDTVRVGDTFIAISPPHEGDLTAMPLGATPRTDGARLSPRELEVLRLVATGLSDSQIASKLNVSKRTVQSHLEHIRTKLGRRKRAELTRYAVDNRWV